MATIMVHMRDTDEEEIPLAVQMEGKLPNLLKLDMRKPLSETVEEVAQAFGVTDCSQYALQIDNGHGDGVYVTESNRKDVKKGTILWLKDSPSKAADDLYKTLNSQNPQAISDALKRLAKAAGDITFAVEFIHKNGHELLVRMVEKGTEWVKLPRKVSVVLGYGDSLGDTLTAFLNLMEHGIIPWDIITSGFVKRISGYVSTKLINPELHMVVLKSFSILESIIFNSTSLFDSIANEFTFHDLSQHLDGSYPDIQPNCLALMNALCMKAPPGRKKRFEEVLASKETRVHIMEKVIRSSSTQMGTELNHQMYVFQQLTFNLLEYRMMTRMEADNETHRGLIVDLRNAAFGTDADPMQPYQTNTTEYQKLGFQSTSNPTLDFQEVPPGVLALECMHHFALKDDHHAKVMEVVREQIETAMKGRPSKPANMAQFWAQVQLLTYDVIVGLREKERSDMEELCSKSPPVVALREQIKPEIVELIKKQRVKSLIEGTKFNKFSKNTRRLKERLVWYCRLSPNMKFLHYGDIQGDEKPSAESLLNTVPISDYVELVTGMACKHAKGADLAFSLMHIQNPESSLLDFVASDQATFDMWTDGLNAVLGKPMVSAQMQRDLDMFLSMEMKLRLLDIVGVHIPSEAPPIPPPPPVEFSRLCVQTNES